VGDEALAPPEIVSLLLDGVRARPAGDPAPVTAGLTATTASP
jgi:hypothetical protein